MTPPPIPRAVFTALYLCALCGGSAHALQSDVMSEAYWQHWNPEVQARIDADIEKNRKADALVELCLAEGTEVQVEQITHDFIFGANIFNFNQLGTTELNNRYKALFGDLFNSATLPFYWPRFELEPNRPRFKQEWWDTEAYWNRQETPRGQPHWRRPATDPIVEFAEEKGLRIHGHPLTWGNRVSGYPKWMIDFATPEERKAIEALSQEELEQMTPAQIVELAPVLTQQINYLYDKRIVEIAEYYGDRIHSWDVVNESSADSRLERLIPGDKITISHYGLMPGDYAYQSLKTATEEFPENVLLNINDYRMFPSYADLVIDLLSRDVRIDIMGAQMHLFDPQQTLDIAAGAEIQTPQQIWENFETIGKAGLPIHLSEITITSPGSDARGREMQAVVTRNLYRLWFSLEPMMGITWWNLVDGGGARTETTISGIFTRNMQPKPAYHALDQLINHEWKTRLTLEADRDGAISFRGFKGRYLVTWTDSDGNPFAKQIYLDDSGASPDESGNGYRHAPGRLRN